MALVAKLGPGLGARLFEANGLTKRFGGRTVVDDVSFQVHRGEAVALVGESGSGKSTIARMIARLEQVSGGRLLLDGEDVLETEPHEASLAYRARVQLVLQDPFASLNPVHTVRHHLERPLLRHRRARPGEEADRIARELLSSVGLEPAEAFIDALPGELSGGQRQRVSLARALAVRPGLLIADEPTSMLDASVRMGVLALLQGLVREHGIGLLLITHDLATARLVTDRVLVLHGGRIVESGPSEALFAQPSHPYTQALMDALPKGSRREAGVRRPDSPGPAPGCSFKPRCREAIGLCDTPPPLVTMGSGRLVRCFVRAPNNL